MLGEPMSRGRSSADKSAYQNACRAADQATDQHAAGGATALF